MVVKIIVLTTVLGSFWLWLFGFIVLLALYEYRHRSSREYQMVKNIPTPPEIPGLGVAHLLTALSNEQMFACGVFYLKKYGDTIKMWIGHNLVVFLSNPNDIELILNTSKHMEKADEYRFFKPWFGDGLVTSKGHHWHHHRKMIAPTFHQSILKSFVPTFVKFSKTVVDRMAKETGRDLDIHDYMSEITVEILLSTTMGVDNLPNGKKIAEYSQAITKMCDIIHKRQFKLLYRLNAFYNLTPMRKRGDKCMDIIFGLTRKIINERKNNFNAKDRSIIEDVNDPYYSYGKNIKRAEGLRDDLDEIDENDIEPKPRLATLDAMIEMNNNPNIEWSEKDVMDEVNTILFEGHDTTSAGLSFALCLLGIHKDIQQKVYTEQRNIFGYDMTRDCTFADTEEMAYLERVIMETLRLYPPIPMIGRQLSSDVKLVSGPYTIPKGTTCVILKYRVHRHPNIYENPDKFDPDNFLPENIAKRHLYSFIPFSAGQRSCVGRKFAMLKLKVLLSTILRHYKVHSSRNECDFRLQADIILKLANGFHVRLEQRRRQSIF